MHTHTHLFRWVALKFKMAFDQTRYEINAYSVETLAGAVNMMAQWKIKTDIVCNWMQEDSSFIIGDTL